MITSLADVRPGDIAITTMSGFIPGFFPVRIGEMLCKESYQVGEFSADHVLICVRGESPPDARYHDLPRAVQAMPRGAEEISLTPAKHWGPRVQWFRLPEDYPGQAEGAAAIARLFVSEKVPYSFLSYLALAAWSRGLKAERLEKWINRRRDPLLYSSHDPMRDGRSGVMLPREAICSVLVDQCWSLVGKRVIEGVARQCVTPGMMAIQLNKRPGIVRSTI